MPYIRMKDGRIILKQILKNRFCGCGLGLKVGSGGGLLWRQ
jgi:hypothetical protein